MDCWVDLDSGTYGASEPLVFIDLNYEEEEIFSDLSDSSRIAVAKGMAHDFLSFEDALARVQ